MAKIEPRKAFDLPPETIEEIAKQRKTLPGVRKMIEALRDLDEDPSDLEAITDTMDEVTKIILEKSAPEKLKE